MRREVARLTLVDLVTDGRIHPARIEEVYERRERQIHDRIVRAAEDALLEVGIADLHPDLIPTLGALGGTGRRTARTCCATSWRARTWRA